MTCSHDQKRYGLFGLPKEAGGCLACAYEQSQAKLAEMDRQNADLATMIKRLVRRLPTDDIIGGQAMILLTRHSRKPNPLRAADSASDVQMTTPEETAAINEAIKAGRINFDSMACDECGKPMVREETNYGTGWRPDCACHDDELVALRKFHDQFRDSCEGLFAQFGMGMVNLYNEAAAARRAAATTDAARGEGT